MLFVEVFLRYIGYMVQHAVRRHLYFRSISSLAGPATTAPNSQIATSAGYTSGRFSPSPPPNRPRTTNAATDQRHVVRYFQAPCYSGKTHTGNQTSTKNKQTTMGSARRATNLRSEEVVELGKLGQIMHERIQLPSEDVIHKPGRRAAAEGDVGNILYTTTEPTVCGHSARRFVGL